MNENQQQVNVTEVSEQQLEQILLQTIFQIDQLEEQKKVIFAEVKRRISVKQKELEEKNKNYRPIVLPKLNRVKPVNEITGSY